MANEEPEIIAEDLFEATEGNIMDTEPTVEEPTVESQDPMLRDTGEAAREIHAGTVNDAYARLDGEVEGQGDVDLATVEPGDGAGEFYAPLNVEDMVVLKEHELVPPRLVGHRAAVIDAPRHLVAVSDVDKEWLIVKTRDEVNVTLSLPFSAVTVERGGRSPVVRG